MGHYHCRGLWEMTPKLLLLILALTASLIAQVRCENPTNHESSGDAEAEDIIRPGTSTDFPPETGHTSEEPIDSYPQALPPPTHTIPRNNSTNNQNKTRKQNLPSTTGSPSTDPNTTPVMEGDEGAGSYIFVIIVSLALALVLTAMVVVAGVLINRKRRREKEAALKEDPYLDAEGREKVPMPMFEDDVPSVMELEMEDLEKWMIKGDGGISMDSKEKQFS
ncbi:transmembrane protein 154 [Salminus brasiliensis]|uniref:transmembrane protein 154 n=1 Tax=Salminus brasiliensis TaxID=930266 RepID=UPI003B835DAC